MATRSRPDALAVAAAALALGAALMPLWSSYVVGAVGSLTVGRLALAVAAAGIVVAGRRLAGELGRPPRALALLLAGLLATWLVITASAATRGSFANGAWTGVTEVLAVAAAAALISAVRPQWAGRLLVAAAIGCVLAAVLGAFGVQNVHGGAGPDTSGTSRLTGPYGNPNFLGLAVACGIPIAAAYALRAPLRWRPVALAAGAGLAAVTVLTYSRGAILAGEAGLVAAIVMAPSNARGRALAAAAAIAAIVAVTALTYRPFDEARTRADFAGQRALLAARDASGLDGGRRGPIPAGPSRLTNPNQFYVVIATDQRGEGASFPLGGLPGGSDYAVTFDAAADPPTTIHYVVADDAQAGAGTVGRRASLVRRWDRFQLRWRPARDAPEARLYVWQTSGTTRFGVRSLSVTQLDGDGAAPVRRKISLKLRGSALAGADQVFKRAEKQFIRSRTDAASLGLDAFKGSPLLGIGWERFADLAAAHDPAGALATHNEYIRIAAELGLLGILAFAAIVAAAVLGLLAGAARRHDTAFVAAGGALVTGGAGLVFVNALATPTTALPFAVAVGVVAAAVPWRAA